MSEEKLALELARREAEYQQYMNNMHLLMGVQNCELYMNILRQDILKLRKRLVVHNDGRTEKKTENT